MRSMFYSTYFSLFFAYFRMQRVSASTEPVAQRNEKKKKKNKVKRTSKIAADHVFSSQSPSLGSTRRSELLKTNDGAIPSSDDTLVPDSDDYQRAEPNDLEIISSRLRLLQKDPEVAESMQAFCKVTNLIWVNHMI